MAPKGHFIAAGRFRGSNFELLARDQMEPHLVMAKKGSARSKGPKRKNGLTRQTERVDPPSHVFSARQVTYLGNGPFPLTQDGNRQRGVACAGAMRVTWNPYAS